MNQMVHMNPADAMQANLGYVLSQTTHIESQVYRFKYPDLRYDIAVPVDTSANPFAKTVTYFGMDGVGKADWINGNVGDVNMVDVLLDKAETAIYTAGIGYGYNFEEVGQGAMLGVSLPNEGAFYAKRAFDEMVYRIVFEGDATKGFEGLFSYTGVTAATVAADGTGSSTLWSTKTGDLIARDINALIVGVNSQTNTVEFADTLILPIERFQYLAGIRLGDTTLTVLEFIRQNNVYTATTGQPLNIVGMRGLLTKGAGSTARMIAYRKGPDVLKFHMPMSLRFLPVQIRGLRYLIPGVFRLGGLDIRLKKAVRYADGI